VVVVVDESRSPAHSTSQQTREGAKGGEKGAWRRVCTVAEATSSSRGSSSDIGVAMAAAAEEAAERDDEDLIW